MRKIKASAFVGCILMLCFISPCFDVLAQENSNKTFELKNKDRVVFLGNSLFESDLRYGYLELALTTRWPEKNLTFRNIGWEGDNVFGQARSQFTNPPSAYELLMQQLKKTKPTLVFIAYGGVEAQEGEAGLGKFNEGFNRLLDTIEQLGARSVLLSPIPVLSGIDAANLESRNKNLKLYADAVARLASARGKTYIDVYKPIDEISKSVKLSEDGIHLNETGYYYLTIAIEKALGLGFSPQTIELNVSRDELSANAPAQVYKSPKNEKLAFTIDETYLPLPLPVKGVESAEDKRIIKVNGLKKGFYTLMADDEQVITASAQHWAKGIEIKRGATYSKAAEIRHMIVKKNDLFFQQYRPLNETYITGFRAYEQGRHKQGLADLDFIITWLEGQIALNSAPKSIVYQLISVK